MDVEGEKRGGKEGKERKKKEKSDDWKNHAPVMSPMGATTLMIDSFGQVATRCRVERRKNNTSIYLAYAWSNTFRRGAEKKQIFKNFQPLEFSSIFIDEKHV